MTSDSPTSDPRQGQAKSVEFGGLASHSGTLAAGVAHGINNPLALLSGHLELADQTVRDCLSLLQESSHEDTSAEHIAQNRHDVVEALGKVLDNLGAATRGTGRIGDIVEDLRIFSQDEESAPYPLAVTPIVESSLRLAAHGLSARIRLVCDYSTVPHAIGRETGLGQVLLNILINAGHAMDNDISEADELVLHVGLNERDGWVVIDVDGSGEGIHSDHRDQVCEPFCEQLVEQMGGELRVKSQPQGGICFEVRLQAVET
jgi:C4-dicarboxylate-specific signal transduction histidine kinase